MTQRPTLLTDEPSDVDALGGAHTRIAETIATLVRTSPGGQTIQLDGTWGAGKSTVVKMVAEGLEQDCAGGADNATPGATDVAVFQYDAWVHVGDPLRRAFLSALIGKLIERRWLDQSDGPANVAFWTKTLDQLGRRLKTTSRRTTPFFSTSAKLILSALAALGFTAPMLSELEKRLISPLGIAPLLASIVLIGFVAFALIHLLSNEAMGFVIRRNSDEETVEVRDDPEPTSIEFQDAFGKLMEAVLEQDERRLVIVVDNLDRIDQSDTKGMWALLRSFLDNPQFKSRDWFRRLWVVVPVADERRMLQSSVPDAAALSPTKDSAPSFLEKVFQLRLSLPPPMLHSWKNYFSAKLTQAFGEDLLGDYDEVLRLYEELPPTGSLTPRGIVSFVNELVVMKLEWSDSVSLSSLAAYVLSRGKFVGDGCSPPSSVSRILREDSLADTFAMLHHRASTREEASYVSVRPKLATALDNADSETLNRLFHESPAFQYVLDRYIRQDLSSLEQQQERLLQAVRAICPLATPKDGSYLDQTLLSPGTMSHLRQVVLSTMSASGSLRLLNENLVPGLRALLDISPSRESTASMIVDMLGNINRVADEQSDALIKQISVGWEAWVSALAGVLSIEEVRSTITVEGTEQVVLPVDAELWARLCLAFRHTERSWILNSCTCRGGENAKLAWLKEQFGSDNPGTAAVALLEQAHETGHEDFFDAIADGIVERSGPFKAVFPTSDDYLTALTTMFFLDRMRLKPYLQRLVANGNLLARFGTSGQPNEWRSAALVYLIIFATGGALKAELSELSSEKEVINGLRLVTSVAEGKIGLNTSQARTYADVLVNLAVYEVLQLVATHWNSSGLVSSVVPALAANEQFAYYIRARGDFRTELIAFANEYVVDQQLRSQFVDAAILTDASTASGKSFDDLQSMNERLRLRRGQVPS